MSTHAPVLEYDARVSFFSEAAVTSAVSILRGSRSQESAPVLPAEVARKTPELIIARSDASSVESADQFHDVLATAGLTALAVTQSTPLMVADVRPPPLQFRILTACSRTSLAMPYVCDPTVPATCVPWPSQSVFLRSM